MRKADQMPENEKSDEAVREELADARESADESAAESEDLEPHGIEVEDDSEAGCLDVNCGCA